MNNILQSLFGMHQQPDDVQPPPSYDTQNSPPRQDLSALARLLNIG